MNNTFSLDLPSTALLQEDRLNDRIFYIEHDFERKYDRLPTPEEVDEILAKQDDEHNNGGKTLPDYYQYSHTHAAVFSENPNAHKNDQIIVKGDGSRNKPYWLITGSGVNIGDENIVRQILSQYPTAGTREFWVYVNGKIQPINLDEA